MTLSVLLNVAPFNRERRLKVAKNKAYAYSYGNDPHLEKDLREILGDYVPRKYGEIPIFRKL